MTFFNMVFMSSYCDVLAAQLLPSGDAQSRCCAVAAFGLAMRYRADGFGTAMAERGLATCIPAMADRRVPILHDAVPCRQRHRIDNVFAKRKNWWLIRPLRPRHPRLHAVFAHGTACRGKVADAPRNA